MNIYSIGHSNHKAEFFISLLKTHRVDLVIDVRSRPYSRYNPQFNQKTLRESLWREAIEYEFLGDSLGGLRSEDECDEKGYPIPEFVYQTPTWNNGINSLLSLAENHVCAVMCSEHNFKQCHRHTLIEPSLRRKGLEMIHIRKDGTLSRQKNFVFHQKNFASSLS